MNTTIEFNDSSADLITCASPWAVPAKSTYQDLLLKPEYANRRFKFPLGTTWIRVVQSLKGSNKDWLLAIHALQYANPKGRHCHPRTIIPGAKSVFDVAFGWLKENRNETLYSKQNKDGVRLLADPLCLFWMITEEGGKPVARLFLGNGYDGTRGGTPGLGYQILQMSKELDEDGNLIGNPADSIRGAQICVERRQTPGSPYPSYSLKRGRVPVPLKELIAKMDEDERSALTPLEEVVYQPTEEEEWKLLENVIDPETVREIRQSIG